MRTSECFILLTGGAGFIGCNLVRHLLGKGYKLVVLDKLTYAGNGASLKGLEAHPGFHFVEGDIADVPLLRGLFGEYPFKSVLNLAAESHVDRSIDGPADFVRTNLMGTFCLLETARSWYGGLDEEGKGSFRFLQVSTDEVFGSLGEAGAFTETTPYAPNSPYSASKAGADHLVRAWGHTYGLPVLTTHCSNNYGPYQFPEKLIPHMILSALKGKKLPVYGDGLNVRDWLHVKDHCRALTMVMERGRPGDVYNIGGHCERTNIDIVHFICDVLDRLSPRQDGYAYREQIEFVSDRPAHDRRYAIDFSKIRQELGWEPKFSFEDGMMETINWYLDNREWTDGILSGAYRLERLGTAGMAEGGS